MLQLQFSTSPWADLLACQCLRVCVHESRLAHQGVQVRRPQVKVEFPPLWLSTFFFETGSLSEHTVDASLGQDPPVSAFQVWHYRCVLPDSALLYEV